MTAGRLRTKTKLYLFSDGSSSSYGSKGLGISIIKYVYILGIYKKEFHVVWIRYAYISSTKNVKKNRLGCTWREIDLIQTFPFCVQILYTFMFSVSKLWKNACVIQGSVTFPHLTISIRDISVILNHFENWTKMFTFRESLKSEARPLIQPQSPSSQSWTKRYRGILVLL